MQKKGDIINLKEYRKYLLFALIIGLIWVSFLVIKDFIITILNAVVIAIIFYPLYNIIKKGVRQRHVAAAITTLFIIAVIAIPLAFMITGIVKESQNIYSQIKEGYESGGFSSNLIDIDQGCEGGFCKLKEKAILSIEEYSLKERALESIQAIGKKMYTNSFTYAMEVPSKIIALLMLIIIVFFLLIEKEKIMAHVERILPLNNVQQNHLITQIKDTIYGVVLGQIVVAVLEGIVGGIGLWLFGVPDPILLGIIIGIFALLPVVGASLVWIPATIYLIVTGIMSSQTPMLMNGIFLLIYCFVLINFIELILKPKLMSSKASVHTVIILIGIIGGLKLFGTGGFILGPLVLSILIKIFEIQEFGEDGV